MLCPECNEEMLVLELRNVEIDFCAECNGIWLDEGELELLLPPESKSGSAIATALQNNDSPKGKGDRGCPVCGKRMLLVDIPIDAPPPGNDDFRRSGQMPEKPWALVRQRRTSINHKRG